MNGKMPSMFTLFSVDSSDDPKAHGAPSHGTCVDTAQEKVASAQFDASGANDDESVLSGGTLLPKDTPEGRPEWLSETLVNDSLSTVMIKGMRDVLSLLFAHEYAKDFMYPDPWKNDHAALANFPELVPEPMCLSFINEMLDNGTYETTNGVNVEAFWSDLDQIWSDTELVFDAYFEYESDFPLLEKSRVMKALCEDVEDEFFAKLQRYEDSIKLQDERNREADTLSFHDGVKNTDEYFNGAWAKGIISAADAGAGMLFSAYNYLTTSGDARRASQESMCSRSPENKSRWEAAVDKYKSKQQSITSLREQLLTEIYVRYRKDEEMSVAASMNNSEAEVAKIVEETEEKLRRERAKECDMLADYNIMPIEQIRSITLDSTVPKPKSFMLASGVAKAEPSVTALEQRRLFSRVRQGSKSALRAHSDSQSTNRMASSLNTSTSCTS